jgi:glycosyltransferase involved in cell wall biosynthesis
MASFLTSAVLLYHEHDTPNPASERSGFMQMVVRARQATARRADLCVLPNEQRAAHFARETGVSDGEVHTVWNCPERRQVAALEPSDPYSTSADNEASVLRAIYLGSIVPDRVPTTVVEAAGRVEGRVEVELVGYETIEHPQYVDKLRSVAERCGVGFTYAGAMPHDDALQHAAAHDVGLALMPPKPTDINMQYMVGASNKAFDYFASAIPLLVTDLPEWHDAFVDPGLARACNPQDASSVAEAFQWLLDHPEERCEMGRRGRQRLLDEWNYECQFEPVKHRLEEAVAADAASPPMIISQT